MKVRRPKLDFSATPAHWARNKEFAQRFNGSSAWIPYLERFLNRVLARTLSQYKDSEKLTPELRENIRTFIRQESNHTALHSEFNAILAREGYDIAAFEKHFEEEFDRMFKNKSLAFLTAYCEGFETTGPVAATVWLDELDDLLEGARPEVVDLWKWHLLEEYEHRTVCYDVFHIVHGGYFMRVYGFFYQLFQLERFGRMVSDHLLAQDTAAMTPEERKQSIKRDKRTMRRFAFTMLPRLFKALSPFYNPRKVPEPRMWKSYRDMIETKLA